MDSVVFTYHSEAEGVKGANVALNSNVNMHFKWFAVE